MQCAVGAAGRCGAVAKARAARRPCSHRLSWAWPRPRGPCNAARARAEPLPRMTAHTNCTEMPGPQNRPGLYQHLPRRGAATGSWCPDLSLRTPRAGGGLVGATVGLAPTKREAGLLQGWKEVGPSYLPCSNWGQRLAPRCSRPCLAAAARRFKPDPPICRPAAHKRAC